MDYGSPIAKRTRLRGEEFWKKLWEERRGKRNCHGIDGSDDEKWRSKGSAMESVSVESGDDSDGSEVKASASQATRGADRKKGAKRKGKLPLGLNSKGKGSTKWGSKSFAAAHWSVDDDDDDDNDDEAEEVNASRPTRGMGRKKEAKRKGKSPLGSKKQGKGSKKRGSGFTIDYVTVDVSDADEEESNGPPPPRGKDKKKEEKRKLKGKPDGTQKWRSGCALKYEYVDVTHDNEDEASEEISDEEGSCGKHENDSVDFEHVDSAASKCKKKSELGPEDIENFGPVDVEDSDDDVVCLGVERLPLDKSETSSSEEESDNSDDEDYNPEKPESSRFSEEVNCSDSSDFSEESNSFGGEEQNSKSDSELKTGHSVKEYKVATASGKAGKGKTVEVGVKRKRSADEANCSGQQANCRNDESDDSRNDDNDKTCGGNLETESDKVKRKGSIDEASSSEQRTRFHGEKTRSYGRRNDESDDRRNDDNDKTCGGNQETRFDKVKRKGSIDDANSSCQRTRFHEEKINSFDRRNDESDDGRNVDNDKTGGSLETGFDKVKRKGNVDEANSSEPRIRIQKKKTRSYFRRRDDRSDDRRNDENEKNHGGNPEAGFDKGETGFGKRNDVLEKTTGSDDRAHDENDDTYDGNPEAGPAKLNDCDSLKTLVSSMFGKGEVTLEGSVSFGDKTPKDETNQPVAEMETLPLKFTFGVQPPRPKKPECDPEEKELWDDLDFALRSCEIDSSGSNSVENQDSPPTVHKVDTATLCRRGVHELILSEEIGLICRFCSYIDQEIRHILPDFISYPYGKSGMKGSETNDRSIFDKFRYDDSGSVPHSGCDSHAHAVGTVWDLIPDLKRSMYPHQVEGFEFLWKHIAGGIDLEKLKKSSAVGGNGCIISHAPGTGKTRLTIVFLQTYMELFPNCKPLLIAPRSMLLTWEEEFKKWKFDIPFHNLNNLECSGEENQAACNILMQGRKPLNRADKGNQTRLLKLYSWSQKRSILGISYHLFEKLSGADNSRTKKNGLAGEMRKILLEFPGLVVFDEGHTPRNDQSHIWKAISEIKTKRRILLSGTPFQNNFQELFNTICLVRPMFAASIESGKFSRHFPRPRGRKGNVEKWQWTSPDSGGKAVDEKEKHAAGVKEKIAPFVNVYKGSVLQDSLPGLRNSVVVLQPTQLQEKFQKRIQAVKEVFRYEHLESIISIHPSLLLNDNAFSGDWDRLKELKLNPDAGMKAKFVVELIRLSNALNERVLVFSQYIDPLILIRDLLKSQFQWAEEEEVLYMDGRCDMKQRQLSMKVFNDPSSKAKVLLASTKGCCEGISLVGASRVVLLDVTWNPSVERQAISRAYRLGQNKIVFVYHLLMDQTNEEHKYSRQVDKSRLSELLFSESDRNALEKQIRSTVSEDKILEEMAQHEKLKHIFKSIAILHEDIYCEQLGMSTFG